MTDAKNAFIRFFRSKKTIAFWIIVHLAIIIIPLILFPIKINSDLLSALPAADDLYQVKDAEKVFAERTSRQFYVLVGHPDFGIAKTSADRLYKAINGDTSLANFNLYVNDSAVGELRSFFYKYRYVLQDPQMRDLLLAGDSLEIEKNALRTVYSAFSVGSLENLSEDPFLLGSGLDRFMNSPLLSGSSLTPREGVLTAADSGVQYIMLRGSLSGNTSGIAKEDHVLGRLMSMASQMQKKNPEIRVAFSGVPFHSYQSSENAQKEVYLISFVSLACIIILFLFVFRSPFPLLASVGYIGVAALTSFSTTILAFREINVLTFVFGTSLIGVCIDYAVHFFIDWKGSKENRTSFDVRSHIAKGICLGFLTTEAGYAAVMLAPFPLLRQMALFSFAGLCSSFLSIMILFPHFPLPPLQKRKLPLRLSGLLVSLYQKIFLWKRPIRLAFAAIAFVVIAVGFSRLTLGNDIRSLYKMSSSLKKSEMLAARVLNVGSLGWYFIVSGDSPEDVLEKEESFTNRLDSLQKADTALTYLATTLVVPSVKTQKITYESIGNALVPETRNQLKKLGFDGSDSSFVNNYVLASHNYLTLDSSLPSALGDAIHSLWVGKVGEKYYSVILPLHTKSEATLKKMASETPSVFFVDKLTSIGDALTRLSHIALALVVASYGLILIVLSFVYGFKTAFRIVRTPIVACVLSTAVLGILGVPFNFFAIVGIILTLSIGIDYSLFFKERSQNMLPTMLAVLLSVTTTLLSFGMLALSSFAPVSTFGLSVLLGISFSFLLSPFNGRSRS
ncbi:MAG: MMPL family transporter [Fibrobacteraceae bacterium]|nr:MMPL family transporter [Fibrobacteraceae bacterium]